MSITSTMLSLKGAEEQEWKDLYNYIIELDKRNRQQEIDIKAFTKENYYNKLEIEKLNNIIEEIIEENKKIEYWDYDKDCTNEWNFKEIKEKLDEIIDKINEDNE